MLAIFSLSQTNIMKKLIWGYLVLLIYFLWIWFISGSIVHFTLNPWRFWLIWIVWWVLFAIATYVQDFWWNEDKDTSRSHILYRVMIWVLLSIGLWMISWSIQHFDEITYEALWYIPIGTALSLISRWLQEKDLRKWIPWLYWLWVTIWLTLLSIVVSWYIQEKMFPNWPIWWHHGEAWGNTHEHENSHVHGNEFKGKSWVLTREDFTNEEKMNIHMCLMWWWEWCDVIKNPINKDTYSDAIQEQCDLMPWMEDCDTYFWIVTPPIDLWEEVDLLNNDSYKERREQETVILEDGDTYEMSIENINTTIDWKEVRMMAYNWSSPWPLIKVKQWSSIKLIVTNNIADIETTVHHHWLRLKDTEDGVPVSMGWFDIPIKKGESLEYNLEFPDAWIYWYHPHVREDLQQELGMYGNYLVEPIDASYWNAVDNEEVLILDDIQMDEDGIAPFYEDHVNQAIMWRFGTHYLINWTENYELELTQGEVTRLYITNSANVRPFNISIPWIKMKLVGWDLWAYEKESFIDSLLIAPAERYVIEVLPEQSWTFDLVYKNPAFTETIWSIQVNKSETLSDAWKKFWSLREVNQVIQDIDQYREYFDKSVDKTLRLDMTLNGKTKDDLSLKMEHPHDESIALLWWLEYDLWNIERLDEMFSMNITSTDETTKRQLIDEDTWKISMMIDDWQFNQWDMVKVRIINDGEWLHPMQHPIHFHGQRFLVLNKNGEINNNLVWKDTFLTLPWEYTDILIDMSNPWKRMAHCHIAEHNENGMMLNFSVE